jgi:hemerythrin-like metal-binding protein
MALLQWKDQYSVGIEAVDHEHRDLIDLINKLHQELSAHSGKDVVEAFFGDLLKGISAHFALEERFMRDQKYRDFDAHKRDHEKLLDEIRDIMDEFSDREEVASDELAERLGAWFGRHFETHDARLHKALGAHPH